MEDLKKIIQGVSELHLSLNPDQHPAPLFHQAEKEKERNLAIAQERREGHWLTVAAPSPAASLPGSLPCGTAACVRACGTILPCGHSCQGVCGECVSCDTLKKDFRVHFNLPDAFLNRLAHHPCTERCGKALPCGHFCNAVCCKGCPPCCQPCTCGIFKTSNNNHDPRCGPTEQALTKDKNKEEEEEDFLLRPGDHFCSKCPFRASCSCVCEWKCPHQSCSSLCHVPCQRQPCNRRCTRVLPDCGHRCVGMCGEICPPLCPACYRGEGGEERRQKQLEIIENQLIPDEVYLFRDEVSEYCTGGELDETDDVVEKGEDVDQGSSESKEKHESTPAPSESIPMIQKEPSYLRRPMEMPCCQKLYCVGYLDGWYHMQNFSEEERNANKGKFLVLLKCPYCQRSLPYPCHHMPPFSRLKKEEKREKEGESSSCCGCSNSRGHGMGCIYRYSRLIKEKMHCLRTMFEEQNKWYDAMRKDNIDAIKLVMEVLLHTSTLDAVTQGTLTPQDLDTLVRSVSRNNYIERSIVLRKWKISLVRKKNAHLQIGEEVQKRRKQEGEEEWGGADDFKSWRKEFLNLVQNMKESCSRVLQEVRYSDVNCLLWYVLLADLTDPSLKLVAYALLNILSSLSISHENSSLLSSGERNSSGEKQERGDLVFVKRIRRTISDFTSYLIRNIFTSSVRDSEMLAVVIEWLRCVLLSLSDSFSRKIIVLAKPEGHHAHFLLEHKRFFNALYFPPPNIFLSKYEKMDVQELRGMIDKAKQCFTVSAVDFLKDISKAIGLPPGNFFSCSKGHIFVIGECGGAMEEGVCPDCKEEIGGTQHKLKGSNQYIGHLIDKNAEMAYPTTQRRA